MNHKFITKVVEGIKVVYLQSPNLYTAYVGFHSMAGAYGENEQNLGVAHYLEHMFFKGTKNLNWEDITRKGTMLGGIQNACTGNYKVSYYLSGLPKDNFEGAVSLLSDMMFNSTFPEAELEKERTVIIEEMKSYQDDHDSFFYAKVANEFANEQTRNDIIGNMETLNNMNRDTLKHYHDTRYGKNNTILLIVGSMPEDEVFKTCAKYLKGNTLIDHVDFEVNSPIIPSVGGTLKMERSGIQQTYVCELFRKTGLSDRNVYNDLVSKIIGGGMNSLLFREVREKRGLCYGVGMSDWPSNNDSGSGIIYSSIAPSKLE